MRGSSPAPRGLEPVETFDPWTCCLRPGPSVCMPRRQEDARLGGAVLEQYISAGVIAIVKVLQVQRVTESEVVAGAWADTT